MKGGREGGREERASRPAAAVRSRARALSIDLQLLTRDVVMNDGYE